VSSERPENKPNFGDAPKKARPVTGGGVALPKAIAVPPRDDSVDAAGRWKVDPTMTPVADTTSASPASPNKGNVSGPRETEIEYVPTGEKRRLRGLLVPLGVCVVGLAATIVVALVTQQQQKDEAAAREREVAAAKAAEPPPEPPPDTSEVILAIRQGDHRVIKSLLDRKADPNEEVSGTTPLLASVARGDADAAKLLLAAGADADRTLAEAPTPLLAAIEKLDVDMATALLDGGADPNLDDDRSGPPLVFAARKGSLPLIKLLLDNQADANGKSANGDTALMLAARQGKTELLTPLLEAGAEVNAANEEKLTPLIYALDVARPEVVKLLLEKGADPLALRGDGESPLLIALTKNQLANYRLIADAIGAAKQRLPGDAGPIPWKYLSELTPAEPAKAAKVPAALPNVKGIESPHGLWLAPPEDKKPARAVYTLDRKFRFFQGFVAVPDSGAMKGEQAVTFRIVGDGKELWKSADIQTTGIFRNFRVDVSEVTKLELFVDCRAEAAGADAVWVEPKLVN
jgi:ankyrin repeat protein